MRHIGKRIADGVYETTRYDAFQFGNNRDIYPAWVRELKTSLIEHGQLKPIEITSDYFIKDGQHRFMALKELGMPIKYIFSLNDSFSIEELAETNSKTKKWNYRDHIDTRAAAGEELFIQLKKIWDMHPQNKFGDIALALGINQNVEKLKKTSITKEEAKRAEKILQQADSLYKLISDSKYCSKKYYSAFINLLKWDLYEYKPLCDAIHRRKKHLWRDEQIPRNVEDAVSKIEFAYNYGILEKNTRYVVEKYKIKVKTRQRERRKAEN